MNCQCGHMRSQHGERFAGKGQVRTLALGCKVSGCGCERYNEKEAGTKEKGDIIPARPTKAKVEALERKMRNIVAMCEDVSQQLKELKAE